MKKLSCFIFLCVITNFLFAQTVLENNAPSIKWSQINTPNFRIIFPKGFDEQGQRMANTMEHIRIAESKSLGSTPRKISIILQNQSAISNGFVSILPRRSEFYAMPTQDYNFIGNNDWLDNLASHEFRHIVQYQHATRGFNRLLYYVFGSTTLAGMAQAAAPSWFWEGDAVATETAFTNTGRGKIPNFDLVFRTNLLEGRTFNYHKQYLRSYKHNIPDHYVLGYHMVSYLRQRTNDPDIWGKITARSWSVPFIPFAFSNAIHEETGMYVTALYRTMANDLRKQWQTEINALDLTSFETVNARMNRSYTDYLYPQPLEDGRVLVIKKGIGDIEQFIVLDENGQEKAYTPGILNDAGMLSAQGDVVVWNEYGFNPRWLVSNYSLIKAYDLKRKRKYVIGGKKSRYGSAALSPDKSQVVTVRTGTDYKTQVVILNFGGKIVREFPNPENNFYSMPRWSDDGKKIVILKNTAQEKNVVALDPVTGEEQQLATFGNENAGHPVLYKNYLFYNSPVSGIDNIYAVDLDTQKKYQVTSSKYGAYNPAITPDGESILYNDQTRNGLDVVRIPFDPSAWRLFEPTQSTHELSRTLVEQEGHPGIFNNVPQKQYPITKFSKSRGLINPYTWGFFVNDDLTKANIGISSRDILSTTNINLGYEFDINERTSAWTAAVSYQGLFPIIDVSASLLNRSVDEGEARVFVGGRETIQDITFKWQEKNIRAGLRIPLVTTSSRFIGNISAANYVGLTNVTDFRNSVNGGGRVVPASANTGYFFSDYQDNGNLLYNNATVYAYRLLKRSRRDINSKWGQTISIDHFTTPFGGDFSGSLFAVSGVLYLPGLFKHHSLWGYGSFQQTDMKRTDDNYIFRNQIPLPRGLSLARFEQLYSASANYTLPVWYPDIAVGPLVNVQRLRANAFFDWAMGSNTEISNTTATYTSVGIEAKLDINIFRFLPQLDIGVRYSVGISPSVTKFEFLLGTLNL